MEQRDIETVIISVKTWLKNFEPESTKTSARKAIDSWFRLIQAGDDELKLSFTPKELESIAHQIASIARADRTNYEEFWGLSTTRLASMLSLVDKSQKAALKLECLSELAGFALKHRITAILPLSTGSGGRPPKEPKQKA